MSNIGDDDYLSFEEGDIIQFISKEENVGRIPGILLLFLFII